TVKGDYAGALDLYKKKIELVEGSLARAAVYSKMGVIAFDKINDEKQATEYFEYAVDIDNSNLIASDKLSGIYRENEKWEEAIAIYERWVPSAQALSKDSRFELFKNAAAVYSKVGRETKALELLQKAVALDSNPELVKEIGELALKMEDWDTASKQFNEYMKLVPDMDNALKLEMLVKRGRAAFGAGHLDEAAKMARQSTVMDAEDVEARILLADVNEERKDFRGAVESRQKVIAALDPADERWFAIVKNTASLMFEKLRNAEGAAELLNNALETNPDSRDILGELLKMHYAAKKYTDVVKVILRITELVDEPVQLSRYYLTVAKIFRRELKDLNSAVEYFNKALEKDPTLKDAENALLQVLNEKKDWEGLEKAYKSQIARLPADATVEDKTAIFAPLADLYMTKMDKEDDAIVLIEALSKIEPSNISWQEKLAELYGWNTKKSDKAIELHARLLKKNVARVDSFRMLYRIYSALEDPDKAWCSASMLSLLNQASPEERQYYRDYLAEGYPPIADVIDDESWKRLLYHDDMNKDITNIFSVIQKAFTVVKCQRVENVGLDLASAVDPTTDPASFSQLVNFGLGVTGIPAMNLFYQQTQTSFGIVDTIPPVMIAGSEAADMKDYLGLAFALGQHLTLLRPGLLAKQVLKSGTELSAWLLAAVKLHVPALPVPNKLIAPVNEKMQPLRAHLTDSDNEMLKGYVQSFVAQAADVDLKRWARSVDHTGDRAGLILCGDIAIAKRVIDGQVQDETERALRIKELSLYMVSESYFKLRKKLGVALQAG
ncbi:MAG: tetratricopeptide repeat protein, partial [Deltaproteobacteria bacterium]|nr:tetratricopeptide repeat protein [Deltaproteobacteria bacterium]